MGSGAGKVGEDCGASSRPTQKGEGKRGKRVRGRGKGEGGREKGEGRKRKGEGRREKAKSWPHLRQVQSCV